MFKKSDLIGSIILGFLVAILFLLLSYTTLSVLKHEKSLPTYYWGSIIVFPLLTLVGLIVLADLAKKLGELFRVVYQIYKFGLVGVLNTLIDLSIINGLIVMTGITGGWQFSAFKAVSFGAAVFNSYLWNKFWTFGKKGGVDPKEMTKFLIIALIGLGINVSIASIVNYLGPLGGIPKGLWPSVAVMVAVIFSMIWNFVGYKMLVFKQDIQ
jgi:putative flippase GtrA